MKGLMKNNYYSAVGNITILLFLFLLAGSAMLIFKVFDMMIILIVFAVTAFPLCGFSGFRKESASKWVKHELTAPVRRKDIIKSKYLSHTVWILGVAILCAAYIGISILTHGNRYFYDMPRDFIAILSLNGIALLEGAVFFPVVYSLGADRFEIAVVTSVLASLGLTYGIIRFINPGGDIRLSDLEYYLRLSVYVGITIAAFILSYFLTTFIYNKKEY